MDSFISISLDNGYVWIWILLRTREINKGEGKRLSCVWILTKKKGKDSGHIQMKTDESRENSISFFFLNFG